MKKLIGVFVALFLTTFTFSWDGGYHIPCYACNELTTKTKVGYSYCLGCPMWRCYSEEGDKGYMIYRCQHGHCIRILKSSDNKSRDFSELEVQTKNGWRKLSK